MKFSNNDNEKEVILGYKDETIDNCIDFEDILRLANDTKLNDKVKDCFTHRLFSH